VKINEVEKAVGITVKNIRFYESQGLLAPRRNSANGYREYGEEEVAVLRQIKLMRKLGVPLEEIRQLQQGSLTLSDAMGRHLVSLSREKESVEQAMRLCLMLKDRQGTLSDLDAEEVLEQIRKMEEDGATFVNKQRWDVRRRRYAGAVFAAAVMVALMLGMIVLMLWAFRTESEGAPPPALMVVTLAVPAVVIFGVVLAIWERLQEIGKGEIDDAEGY